MHKNQYKRLLPLILTLALTSSAYAQFGGEANHPELVWETLETGHFKIHYHRGLQSFATRAAEAAEEVFGAVTRLYGYVRGREPGPKGWRTARRCADRRHRRR